jgi:hypothetical protein
VQRGACGVDDGLVSCPESPGDDEVATDDAAE